MIKKIEMHMYFCTGEYGHYTSVDSIDWRKFEGCMKGRTYLGSQVVDFDFPEIDERQSAIDSLAAEIETERASSQLKVNALFDRISKLQAIGHEVAE